MRRGWADTLRGMPGLFPAPRRREGPRERATRATLTRWRAAGHDVDEITSSALRAAAEACDLAQRSAVDNEHSPLSYARAVAVWWQLYREASPDAAATDAVDDALVQLLAEADAATG